MGGGRNLGGSSSGDASIGLSTSSRDSEREKRLATKGITTKRNQIEK